MVRSRLALVFGGLLLFAGIVTWVFAAEARGSLPAGSFEVRHQPDWLVTAAHADVIRRDALTRAVVRVPAPPEPSSDLPDSLVCRYLSDEPSGTSAKFNCVLDGGEIIKVKYGRNP